MEKVHIKCLKWDKTVSGTEFEPKANKGAEYGI
jgi:hypothetical protein